MAEKNKIQNSVKSAGDESTIPPVIDLRDLEPISSTGSAAQTGGTAVQTGGTAAATQGASPAQTGGAQPAATAKPKSVSLEEEAMMAESQSVIAPPEKFTVPSLVKEKFPDLIQLIKDTESMNDDERNYWFQILPIMTEVQIQKFQTILVNEKMQLKRLDKEYEDEVARLNTKHMIEWKEFESKEKRKAIQTAEAKAQEEEQVTEEELLKRLSQP
jgi:hypothetical protein